MARTAHIRDWLLALLIAAGTAALIVIAAFLAEAILKRQVIQDAAALQLEELDRDTHLITKRLAGRVNDLFFLKSVGEHRGIVTNSGDQRSTESFYHVLEAFVAASSSYHAVTVFDNAGKVLFQISKDPAWHAGDRNLGSVTPLTISAMDETLRLSGDEVYFSDVEDISFAGGESRPDEILMHLGARFAPANGSSSGGILLSYHFHTLLQEVDKGGGAPGDYKAVASVFGGWTIVPGSGGRWTMTRSQPSDVPPPFTFRFPEEDKPQWIVKNGDVYCISGLGASLEGFSPHKPQPHLANPQRLDWKIITKIPKASISSAIREKQSGVWLVSGVAMLLMVPVSFAATLAFQHLAHVRDQIDKIFKSSMHGIISLETYRKPGGELQGLRVVRSNRAGAQLLKPGGKEIIDELAPWVEEVSVHGIAASREFALEQEGSIRWFYLRATQLGDGAVVTFADVTRRKQDEEVLRSSESSLRLAARMSKVGGWSLAMPERILYWSPETRRIHAVPDNYQPDVGKALAFYPPAASLKVAQAVEACEKEGRTFDFEVDFHDAQGRAIWVRVIGEPEYDQQTGELRRIVGTFQDITESREAALALSESRERLAVAFWGAGMSLADWQEETDEIVVEEHWAKELGYELQEIGESPGFWQSLIPDEDRSPIQLAKNAYFSGKTELFEAEYRMKAKDASFRWVLLRARISEVNKDGRPARMSGVLVDITARKAMEEQLAAALENEKELTRASQAAEKAKRNFLAVMSHEIRTPMNSIIGFADVLLEGNLPSEERDYTRTIKESGEALLRIINDILDYSRIESGRLQLEKAAFSPAETVETVVTLLSRMAKSKGISLTAEVAQGTPTQLVGDAGRLSQILMNLAGNAIKFTQKGSVTISVEPVPDQSPVKHLRFRVKDTGIGIPAEKLGSIFEPFTQADASISRSHGGTGLGLAISKLLVNLLGGTLQATSTPDIGSEFCFELPFATRTSIQSLCTPPPVFPDKTFAAAHPLSILVAEDDNVNARLTRLILEKLGYHPDLVADGKSALESCRSKPYDLVLMDVHMPRMDGIEATREIRNIQQPHTRPEKTRIVAFTADVLHEERQACMAAGMDDYLTKPLAQNKLCEVLRQSALILGKATET